MKKLYGPVLLGFIAVTVWPIVSQAQAKEPAEARSLYSKHCASCHGADGTGNTPIGKKLKIRDLRSPDVQKTSNAQLTAIIRDGKGKMPPFKSKLKPEEIRDLVTYIRTLGKQAPKGAGL